MSIRSFIKNRMTSLCVFGALSLACLVGGAMAIPAKADNSGVAQLKQEFAQFCASKNVSLDGAGYNTAIVNEFMNSKKDAFASLGLKAVNGNGTDVLTDEGVNAVLEIFGIDKDTLLDKGNTIGSINGDKLTGSYKATSKNGVSAGKVENGDFSIVVMGDQQSAIEYHSATVSATYDYLVDNADDMNLKAFINVGDIVDDVDFLSWRQPTGNSKAEVVYHPGRMGNWKMQLQFAANQAEKLVKKGIPTVMCMGNHDYEDMAESYRVKDNFNEYFPLSTYENNSWWGGNKGNDIEASYYYFEGNGQKYMVLTLGTYPTDDMLAWANEVVANNPDRQVIVVTHAYIYGEPMDLREDGMYMWDTFVSQHENIFMVVCGHECTTSGEVIRRVDYGKNGNPVTQFMINPQKEDFLGAGTFAQMIFRKDGTVDFVYYSPYCNDAYSKGYFMDENQFTFTFNPTQVSIDAKEDGITKADNTVNGSSLAVSFLSREEKLDNLPVCEYYNVSLSKSGLVAGEGGGYVVFRMNAGEYERFNKMCVTAQGKFLTANGAYQFDLSRDGKAYTYALYNNAETGYFNRPYVLDRFVTGASDLYVKLSLREVEISKLFLDGDSVQTVFEGKNFLKEYSFDNDTPFYNYSAFDTSKYGAIASYYACLSNNILGSGASGRLSYKSNVVYRFDAGAEKRYFNDFSIDGILYATDLYADAEGHEFQDPDVGYLARIWVRYNDGEYTLLEEIKNDATAEYSVTNGSYKEYWFNINLKNAIEELKKGEEKVEVSSIEVKIDYLGSGRSFAGCGVKNVKFAGNYNKAISTKEEVTHNYVLNGGFFADNKAKTPSREGYQFDGWYLDKEMQSGAVNPKDYEDKAYTFYAKWKRELYYVTYVLNGGENSARNVTSISANGKLYLGDAKKQGYAFVGWYDAEGNEYTQINGKELKGDLALYAQYAEIDEAQGCAGSVGVVGAIVGSILLVVVALFTKKDYGTL